MIIGLHSESTLRKCYLHMIKPIGVVAALMSLASIRQQPLFKIYLRFAHGTIDAVREEVRK
jgi:hypothetical protein